MSFLDQKGNRVVITVLWVLAFVPTLIIFIIALRGIFAWDIFSLLHLLSIIICTVFMFINLHKTPYNFSWVTKWAAIHFLICSSLVAINIIRFIIADHSFIIVQAAELLAYILPAIYLFSFNIKKPKITLVLFVISCVATLILFIYDSISSYSALLVNGNPIFLFITLGLLMRQKDPWECPACHYSNRPKAKFCGQCGRQKDITKAPDIHQPQ